MRDTRYRAILSWIHETINVELVHRRIGFDRFLDARRAGLQALVRVLRTGFSPGLTGDEIVALRQQEELEERKRRLGILKQAGRQERRREEERQRRRLEDEDQRKRRRNRRRLGRGGGRAKRSTAG